MTRYLHYSSSGELTKRTMPRWSGRRWCLTPSSFPPVAAGARPLVPDTLTDYYKRTANKVGIATHFHELRHFAATTAIGPAPT
jgi:hypothetical protein